ncbi:MAG TPA: hypothetical protein VHX65_13490 [Pirellulales bacterium]|jgi:hypothetical protein|nr:hypothetical protein [Pirellulales bacterium]
MNESNMNRRDFQKLTAAAFGGVVAGSVLGRSVLAAGDEAKSLLEEPHVCRGLNTCKGKGGGAEKGKNACAGQGDCATVAKHDCKGENACKGQGGCGANPGENSCKGKGSCGVPMTGKMWDKARANFEAAMKKAGKKVGPAPAK